MTSVGVVGHVEWVDFAVVDRLPRSGEIVEARGAFAEPGGGGAVAAVNLRRLAGACTFLTAVGDDDLGARAERALRGHGVDVRATVREGVPQRRAFTHLSEADAERTITVTGERVVPHRADPLPWDDLGALGGIYFTGGDAGALRAARAAPVLVATPRARDALATAGVAVDVLVASATDAGERLMAGELDPSPRHVVLTRGGEGGTWEGADGATGAFRAVPLPGPPVDSYGCGDTFAAALTLGLARGDGLGDALVLAARCGAAVLTGRGPYGAPLPA